MKSSDIHVVTGAFGYSGKYIARRLLQEGHRVRTLTNSLGRANPFGDEVKAYPFDFDEPDRLVESLSGASVLYNTYWVRFNYTSFTHSTAVENSIKLFHAAKRAGVKRIVHISILNPSEDSHLEYFSGKGRLERAIKESGLSYGILRPAVLFGKEDILINNIAWLLRRLPVFGVFGNGLYKLQPIYVDDLARLAVEQGREEGNSVIDAIGPETFTFRGLVEEIGKIIERRTIVVSIPPSLGYLCARLIGKCVGDVILTRDEIEGLMENLLYTDAKPVGRTRLTEWARENAEALGVKYASELARRRDRVTEYHEI